MNLLHYLTVGKLNLVLSAASPLKSERRFTTVAQVMLILIGGSKMSKSKNILPSYFTVLKIIFSELRYGRCYTVKEIRGYTGFSKQRLNYWLEKLVEDGILHKQERGTYEMTGHGKRIYDQYERLHNKQLVRIENMHVTYKVISGTGKLFERLDWKKGGLKNTKVYTSRLRNHTVRLIKKEGGYIFQVYVTKVLGESPKDAYHHARLEADDVAGCAEWWGAKLSAGWVSSEPEIAIPSPIASALLMTNEASQIRTNKGIMNRSKGRGADWEPRDLQEAQKIVDMPDAISRLEEKSDRNEEKLDRLLLLLGQNSYSDLAGSSHLGFI